MKCRKLFSGILAAAIFFIHAVPVDAAESSVNLYTGEASAEAWTCPVTIPVADKSIYTEGNTIAVQCSADAAPYFVLTSNSGGESWAQVLPDGADGDWYYYSYDAMSAEFGTDFSLLDYISIMAADAPVTVYSIDMLLGSTADEPEQDDEVQHESRVVGYLPDWSYQAYGNLDFTALTHLNISFCNPDSEGNFSCCIPDSEMKNIVNKAHSSDVRVMAALGGGGGCDGYLSLIDTQAEMADFNEKIMTYCETYNLDGIDLDIELGSNHEIWNYYADWVSSLRVLCDERGYELSTATAQWVAVNVSLETFALFDFVNVMAYDNDADESSHADMEFAQTSLQYFNVQKKIPKDRLVLGVPFYGRGYTAEGALDWNSYVAFSELVASDTANYDADLYNGIAYNGASTMREKCTLAKEYGGIMIWELSQDAAGEYALLSVIKDAMTVSAVRGDVNADGKFSVADAVALQRWLLCVPDAKLADRQAGDLCEDERIDVFDLCVMKRLLIEKHPSVVKSQVCIIGDDTLPAHVKSKLANVLSEQNPELDYSDLTFENTGWNYITDSSFNLCGKYYFFDVYYKGIHLDKERYDIIVMDYDDGTFTVEGHGFLQDLSLDKAAGLKLTPSITKDEAIEKAKEYCTDLAVPEELTADSGEAVITSMINPTAEFVIYSLEEGISAYKIKAENTELTFTEPDKASSTLSIGVTVYVDPETGNIIDCDFTKGWIMY